ncbi:hypothetical protein [Massilia horti]|uniref:Uncharacterized protein n=1 Tax=Massilia horti TaxID=2562153 RepID=A0A4Y9TBD6_9BURK|nr:hypothetical protein [Massilia horti]TFW36189.1 hypothetical protein E4O92_00345 [Massilia horti]
MSRWLADHCELHVSARGISLLRGGERIGLACQAGEWELLAAELPGCVPANARLSVTLADCWARYFLLVPPDGLASLRDCRLLLAARFEALYGQPADDWLLQADWQAGAPMLACAIPRGVVRSFAAFRLARLLPELLDRWNRYCPRLPLTGALCGNADGLANLLYWRDGLMRVVRQQRGADPDALLALELARLGAQPPQALFWSGPAAPAGWAGLEERA